MIRAEAIDCALHDRVFSLPMEKGERCWCVILLTAGNGWIISNEDEANFAATSVVWMPWARDMRLKIAAGSVGYHLAITSDTLINAVGHNAESSELRSLTNRKIIARLDEYEKAVTTTQNAFELICREALNMSAGATTMIEAQIRAILVTLWRNTSGSFDEMRGVGLNERILQHFRQAVETHFRDHHSIGKYAADVGISPDRLHDICTRHLARSPKDLVLERILHEAQLMLNNTTLSVDQVSAQLGYRDVTYFSRVFKAKVGQPPATYRRQNSLASGGEGEFIEKGFADWP